MNTKTTVLVKSIANSVSNSTSLEYQLTDFVQKSLADSYSQDIDANLQLLDVAWEVQKRLWQLQDDTQI